MRRPGKGSGSFGRPYQGASDDELLVDAAEKYQRPLWSDSMLYRRDGGIGLVDIPEIAFEPGRSGLAGMLVRDRP